MELVEFREKLNHEVALRAESNGDYIHAAFVDYTLELMSEAGVAADVVPCYLRDSRLGNRLIEMDAYATDDVDQSLKLFYADRSGDTTMTRTRAQTIFDRLRAFVEGSISGKVRTVLAESSEAYELAEYIRAEWKNVSRVRAYLITDAVRSSQILDWPEGEIGGIPFECHIWDIERMLRVENSRSGLGDLIVKFGEAGVPCLQAALSEEKYNAYLCVMPGNLLADMYDEHGSRLLEGNVRAFLSARGKVNKGMRNTIMQQPEMVFAYNNGIAATAASIKIERGPEGYRLIEATELQIVNGGQTTASLSNTRRADKAKLDSVFVPMKLSVIDGEESGDMIQNISRFANTQNKVNDSDFFANHEFHRRMEVISRRMPAPAVRGHMYETYWFYERARAQYDTAKARLTESQRKRFLLENPPSQKITKTDLAKFENSWGELPHIVSKGAQANFTYFADSITKRWDTDGADFGEEYYRHAVVKALFFKATAMAVKQRDFGGYGANIITYTLARIALEIRSLGLVPNFRDLWAAQEVSASWKAQIQRACVPVFEAILATPPGEVNVTQWCKKQTCWLAIQKVPCEISAELRSELKTAAEDKNDRTDAKRSQKLDSGIEAQSRVLEIGPSTWSALRQWAREKGLLTATMDTLLKRAALEAGDFPDAKESARLLELKRRLEEEGFAA